MHFPRYDTGVCTNSLISVYFDPLIAKITVWAPTRDEAIRAMEYTLRQTVCLGLVTNKRFLLAVLGRLEFVDGTYTTRLVETMLKDPVYLMSGPVLLKTPSMLEMRMLPETDERLRWIHATIGNTTAEAPTTVPLTTISWTVAQELSVVAMLFLSRARIMKRPQLRLLNSSWRVVRSCAQRESFSFGKEHEGNVVVDYIQTTPTAIANCSWEYIVRLYGEPATGTSAATVRSGWTTVQLTRVHMEDDHCGTLELMMDGRKRTYFVAVSVPVHTHNSPDVYIHHAGLDRQFCLTRVDPRKGKTGMTDDPGKMMRGACWGEGPHAADTRIASGIVSSYTSTMPCRILQRLVDEGAMVKVGQALLTMESMKMETRLYSRHEGKVHFRVAEGQVVEAGVMMLEVE